MLTAEWWYQTSPNCHEKKNHGKRTSTEIRSLSCRQKSELYCHILTLCLPKFLPHILLIRWMMVDACEIRHKPPIWDGFETTRWIMGWKNHQLVQNFAGPSTVSKPRDGLHGRCLQQRGRHPVMQSLNILTLAQQLGTGNIWDLWDTGTIMGLQYSYIVS